MKILLTGSSGFIGSRVAARLAATHKLYCVTRHDGVALPAGTISVKQDLAAQLDPRQLPAHVDVILHLAQSTHYREFPQRAADIYAINTASTAALLEYAANVGAGQFVLASTGTIYEPYTGILAENSAVTPTSFYSATKLAAEALSQGWSARVRTASLRLFFPYGRGQRGRLVPELIERIRSGRPVSLSGPRDGMVLAPTFVDDIAAVFQSAAEDRWQGLFNVAAPQVVSLRELAEEVGRVMGVAPRFTQHEEEMAPRIVPELSRLAERFDLSRFRPLSEGLLSAVL